MSGGSMDYLYQRVESDARFHRNTPARVAFAKHLELVCKALHDIEWVDSGDYAPGDEDASIRACLGQDAVLSAAVENAEAALESLRNELDRAKAK